MSNHWWNLKVTKRHCVSLKKSEEEGASAHCTINKLVTLSISNVFLLALHKETYLKACLKESHVSAILIPIPRYKSCLAFFSHHPLSYI